MKIFKLRKLKIAEQIILVLLFAVLAPLTISGIIVNNVNQHAVREQLQNTALLLANMVSDEMDFFDQTVKSEISQLSTQLKFIPKQQEKAFLNAILEKSELFNEIYFVSSDTEFKKIHEDNLKNKIITIGKRTEDGRYLILTFPVDKVKSKLFKSIEEEKRQIYVVSPHHNIIAAHNYSEDVYKKSLELLPKNLKKDEAVIYGDIKNQPIVYLKKSSPDTLIIVNTTKKITREHISYNRDKIILTLIISALTIFFIVGLYTYYLYINIRQLFKAIIAISKGNYERQIRLLTNLFTPYEIIFLAFEFNRMVKQIQKSHQQMKKKNKMLKQLNEFRSSMIDTVSHEFRTPLTSIQGYTSRLLRQDIQIDEETKQKSLHIIKKQTERLKRMIEDLLVIPEIEGLRLNVNLDENNLYNVMETAITLVKNDSAKTIVNHIENDGTCVLSDADRLEQVFVNLVENAIKYAPENSEIHIESVQNADSVSIYVKNKHELLSKETLNTLFGKFTRLDSTTTRTTRGTGLGLFIVKGLVEAMNGTIKLSSTEEWGFIAKVTLAKF